LHDVIGGKVHSTSRLIRVQAVTTPEFIRRKDPEFGDKSMLVQRCRSYKDEPFMFSSSYVPAVVSVRLTRRQLARQVVLTALDGLGNEPAAADQVTTAVLADTVAARHLGIEPAAALLCIHRLIRDGKGRSIEHQSHLFRPDRFQLRTGVTLDRSSADYTWSEPKAMPMPAAL
jgi:GntR family transcriptional regulator